MYPPKKIGVDEDKLTGKVIIENIPRRNISKAEVAAWLKGYGSVSDIKIYKECILVQFGSDLEAAGAVQCENGAQFFGSKVSVKHAESSALVHLRQSDSSERFTSNPRRGRERDRELDRERDREYDRDRDRTRDRDRARLRDRDPSPRDRHTEGGGSYDRRRKGDDQSPRRRSRSPLNSRGDRRHVHPLIWLSEVAASGAGSANANGSKVVDRTAPVTAVTRTNPPYMIAIIAVQHDVVPYAETIEKRVSTDFQFQQARNNPTRRTHIIVLLSADHLTLCLSDLTRDGVPFAVICTTTNWTHGSCTLRILHAPTQQEHRNMPLDDALSLLKKEYETYLSGKDKEVKPVSPEPEVTEDHTFLAPSRNLIKLLRMLADSRTLSIGELDEIADFVQERKRRLEGRRSDASADARNGSTADLKSRILNMLYPTPANASPAIGGGMPGPLPTPSNISRNEDQPTEMPRNLATITPAVQQALDTLMKGSTNPPGQSFPGMPQSQVHPSDGFSRALPPMAQGVPTSGNHVVPSPLGRGDVSNLGGLPRNQDYPSVSNQFSYLQSKYSTYKQPPYGSGVKPGNIQENVPYKKEAEGFRQDSAVGRPHPYGQDVGSFYGSAMQSTESIGDDRPPSRWSGRNRGKRGGQGKANAQPGQPYNSSGQVKSPYGQAQRSQPINLMSADVTPVGTLAEAMKHTPDAFYSSNYQHTSHSGPQYPYFSQQPSSYGYPTQPSFY